MTIRLLPDDRWAVIAAVADRLHHPDTFDDGDGPRSRRWWAQSIAHGAAGVAILHASLHRAGDTTADTTGHRTEDGRQLIHRWLAAAVAAPLSAAPGAGAWFGTPAVAFAFAHAAPDGTYRRARADLDRAVDDITRERLDHTRRRLDRCERPQLREFDLVNGLAGIGGYLLQRDPTHPLVTDVLAYLVTLTEPVDAPDPAAAAVPGWWTADPPSRRPAVTGGHCDQGAAHGIAGPLSLLALAGRAGVWVPGQRQAMHRITAWYDMLARTGPGGRWWLQRLTWAEHTGAETPEQSGPGRPSWCYSTPGIARALQLSAIALEDPDRRRQAEQALAAAVTDPAQLGRISDVSLCHGWAGTVLTTSCAARDSTDSDLAGALNGALTALVDTLTDAVPALPPAAPIGLIHGAAGAALTLHALTHNHDPDWARCLLLL